MTEEIIKIDKEKKILLYGQGEGDFAGGGNLNLCLTCGACASGCPATGLENMDPRKFIRMVAFGLDEEITEHPWVWMCTMCGRCMYACPMKINIPALIFEGKALAAGKKAQRNTGVLRYGLA